MVSINPKKIEGDWASGVALDVHTISSTYLGPNEFGHDQYETIRSEIGELLYRLKYSGDKAAAAGIVEAAAGYLDTRRSRFDLIVPVPPSKARVVQPVLLLAKRIAKELDVEMADCIETTRSPQELKSVSNPEERRALVKGLYTVNSKITAGRKVLLFDDLYRSGATMNTITNMLMKKGKAEVVRALTITRTRSNR